MVVSVASTIQPSFIAASRYQGVHNTRAIKIGRRGDDQNWPRPGRIESVRKKEQRATGGRSRISALSCVFLEIIAQRKLKVERAATLNLMFPERGSVAHGKKERSGCNKQRARSNVVPLSRWYSRTQSRLPE